MPYQIRNHLLLRNLGRIYLHIWGVILWLYGAIAVGGLAIAFIDGKPILDAMYFAFITALTIGYGDITPAAPLSKLIAIVIGFLGVVFTGIIVAASLKALEMTIGEKKERD